MKLTLKPHTNTKPCKALQRKGTPLHSATNVIVDTHSTRFKGSAGRKVEREPFTSTSNFVMAQSEVQQYRVHCPQELAAVAPFAI